MFSHVGGAEFVLLAAFGLFLGLLPLIVAIWVVVTLAKIQRTVERMAAALDRLGGLPPRGP